LLAGALLSSGTTASGVVAYLSPGAASAGIAVFALSFCRRLSDSGEQTIATPTVEAGQRPATVNR
jgi:hypothetical protein